MTEYLMGIIAVGGSNALQISGIIVAIFAVLIFILMLFAYGSLWLQARLSGAAVSFAELIGMTLRKVNARTITVSRITAAKAGIELSTAQLESHFLARGRHWGLDRPQENGFPIVPLTVQCLPWPR